MSCAQLPQSLCQLRVEKHVHVYGVYSVQLFINTLLSYIIRKVVTPAAMCLNSIVGVNYMGFLSTLIREPHPKGSENKDWGLKSVLFLHVIIQSQ